MGSEILDPGALRGALHHVPDRLRRDSFAPDSTHPVYSPEDCSGTDAGSYGPLIKGPLHPRWHGDCADVFSFADQIGDNPVILPDLEVFSSESYRFGPVSGH